MHVEIKRALLWSGGMQTQRTYTHVGAQVINNVIMSMDTQLGEYCVNFISHNNGRVVKTMTLPLKCKKTGMQIITRLLKL